MARFHAAAAFAVAACLAFAGTGAAEGASPFAVCFAENDPPRSLRSGEGPSFDVDVARLLAAKLNRPLRLVWMPESAQTDIESTDLDFRPLLRGECDVQLSVPGEGAVAHLRGRLALSEPYYGAAYELLPQHSPLRWGKGAAVLGAEPDPGRVAVVANSVAHVAVNAAGLRWTMQEASADVLGALADSTATAGLVWGPDLALLAGQVERSADFEPPEVLRWNLHAATRRGDPLLADLNRVFADAEIQRRILALLSQHGIPSRPPFETVHTREGLAALVGTENP